MTDFKVPKPKGLKCPHCNNDKHSLIFSHSTSWWCKVCSRQFSKIYIPRKPIIDPSRPPCPYCGTMNPTSCSNLWRCSNPECYHKFSKVYLRSNPLIGDVFEPIKIKSR